MDKGLMRRVGLGVCLFCMVLICADSVMARPPRRYYRRGRTVVVKPKVVAPSTSTVVVASKHWPAEKISAEELTPAEIKKRRIKPEYGLIDFEVYPYTSKIYIDGSYKGYARTLNKNDNSPKVRKGKHVVELRKKDAPVKIIRVNVKAGYKTIIDQG